MNSIKIILIVAGFSLLFSGCNEDKKTNPTKKEEPVVVDTPAETPVEKEDDTPVVEQPPVVEVEPEITQSALVSEVQTLLAQSEDDEPLDVSDIEDNETIFDELIENL